MYPELSFVAPGFVLPRSGFLLCVFFVASYGIWTYTKSRAFGPALAQCTSKPCRSQRKNRTPRIPNPARPQGPVTAQFTVRVRFGWSQCRSGAVFVVDHRDWPGVCIEVPLFDPYRPAPLPDTEPWPASSSTDLRVRDIRQPGHTYPGSGRFTRVPDFGFTAVVWI